MVIQVKVTRKENLAYYNCPSGTVVNVEFEQYVAAVVASEIGNASLEACKVQAIIARTYAISRGVLKGAAISDESSTAQAYRAARYDSKLYPNCIAGANATEGMVLYYKNKIISTVYSACNGGRTVSAKERWGNDYPYLIEQVDPWDAATGKKKNGHGVGLSQEGAMYAATHGVDYESILAFYYPGTDLRTNYGAEPAKQTAAIIKDNNAALFLEELKQNIQSIITDLKKIKESS